MVALASDWLTRFWLLHCMAFNNDVHWWNWKVHIWVLLRPICQQRWPSWPMNVWNNFSFCKTVALISKSSTKFEFFGPIHLQESNLAFDWLRHFQPALQVLHDCIPSNQITLSVGENLVQRNKEMYINEQRFFVCYIIVVLYVCFHFAFMSNEFNCNVFSEKQNEINKRSSNQQVSL